MRKTFLAALSAIAVACGLAVTVGTASAATPRPADRDDISCTLAAGATNCTPTGFANGVGFPSGYTAPVCTPATGASTCFEDYTGPRPAGLGVGLGVGLGAGLGVPLGYNPGGPYLGDPQIMCPLGEHRFGPNCVPGPIPAPGWHPGLPLGGPWHPGLPWVGHPLIYGHQLWLNANLALDVCAVPSYPVFLDRYAVHRAEILGLLGPNPEARWLALHGACGPSVAIPSGLALINRHFLNLDLLGLRGAGLVDVCAYADWNAFNNALALRYGAPFGLVRGRFGLHALDVYRQLRLQAACNAAGIIGPAGLVEPVPSVTDPGASDPAPAATPATTDPAPAATPAPAPQVSSTPNSSAVPSGSVNTGGYDPLVRLILG
jgi:hypothetical protein